MNRQPHVVDALFERDGDWNVTGVLNGTALHRAAWTGDLAMVERLIARGADPSNRDNPFTATAFGWAVHNRQAAVGGWLRAQGLVDLHDAVAHNLTDDARPACATTRTPRTGAAITGTSRPGRRCTGPRRAIGRSWRACCSPTAPIPTRPMDADGRRSTTPPRRTRPR